MIGTYDAPWSSRDKISEKEFYIFREKNKKVHRVLSVDDARMPSKLTKVWLHSCTGLVKIRRDLSSVVAAGKTTLRIVK